MIDWWFPGASLDQVRAVLEHGATQRFDRRVSAFELGWSTLKNGELVEDIVNADLRAADRDHLVQRSGYQSFNYNE